MKKLLIICLVVVLLLSSSINVFAASYCGDCNTYTVDRYCTNNPWAEDADDHVWDNNGVYETCVFGEVFYRSFYECSSCSDNYFSGAHLHLEFGHDCDLGLNGTKCTLPLY